MDSSNNVYLSAYGSNQVVAFTRNSVRYTVAGTGTTGSSGDGGPATSAQLNHPRGLAVDTNGNVYVTDADNNKIRRISIVDGIISTYAGTGVAGNSGDFGAATSAQLNNPQGIAADTMGNFFVADCYNNKVRRISTVGIITTYAGTGTIGSSGDRGAATSATIGVPAAVALDTAGNLYIADYTAIKVRFVTPSGIITTIAGNGAYGFSGDGGAATLASFGLLRSVAVNQAGDIYIADYDNRVRVVNRATGNVTTFAGWGGIGDSGDGGPATLASLNDPESIGLDAKGYFLIRPSQTECSVTIAHLKH